MIPRRWLPSSLAVLLVVAPGPASAQAVYGQLVAADSDRPLPRAFVILRDAAGVELRRTLTDVRGRYFLPAPGAGTYHLQTAVIGVRTWTSPPFQLAAQDTLEYRIELALRRVRLDSVVVVGDARCRDDPTGGEASLEVWTEARKALAAVSWTERADSLEYDVLSFRRELNPGSLRPVQGEANRLSGHAQGSPFFSADPDSLSAHGYVQSVQGGWKPFGPDAEALLSDAFANDHCFFLREHPDDSTLIGLAFEPDRGRRSTPDIAGVFWIERESAGLQSLEFRYRNLPWPVSTPHIGGEVDFQEMSNGLWIVQSWRLRLPELRRVGSSLVGPVEVSKYFETGGLVVQLRNSDGSVLQSAEMAELFAPAAVPEPDAPPSGVLRGTVADSSSGAPVEGAAVLLLDEHARVHDLALSTPFGWFELEAPGAGRFRINVHRRGYVPSGSEEIYLGDGRIVDLEARLIRLMTSDPDAAGFERRREEALTLYAFDAERIAELGAETVLDVLLSIPGVRWHPDPQQVVHLNTQRCRPEILIDGVPAASPRFLNARMDTWVSAVEVFLEARDTPQEFIQGMRTTAGACGTIAIWTKSLIG